MSISFFFLQQTDLWWQLLLSTALGKGLTVTWKKTDFTSPCTVIQKSMKSPYRYEGECLYLCNRLVTSPGLTLGVPQSVVASIGSSSPVTLKWISRKKWMDEQVWQPSSGWMICTWKYQITFIYIFVCFVAESLNPEVFWSQMWGRVCRNATEQWSQAHQEPHSLHAGRQQR